MDEEDWWRMVRRAGSAQDVAALHYLMLRYRPIAPKPIAGLPHDNDKSLCVTSKRTKRKYVRDCKNKSKRKDRSGLSDQEKKPEEIVTLQLLPEKADNLDRRRDESLPFNFENLERTEVDNGADLAVDIRRRTVIESWVRVESVTAACVSHELGYTDPEIMDGLDKDACPCFVSDASHRVTWLNRAYKNMVSTVSDGGESPEIVVWLVINETAPFHLYKAFTCRMMLEYRWQNAKCSKTVPCDVWKMDFGGFAWRLDTQTALTLGLRR